MQRSLVVAMVVLCGCHSGSESATTYDLTGVTATLDLVGADFTNVDVTRDLTGLDQSGLDLSGAPGPSPDLANADLATGGSQDPVAPMTIVHDKNESNFIGDEYQWIDAEELPRSALLTHNDQQDPQGHWGGLLRRLSYRVGAATRACVGTNGVGHPGFGKIISHYDSTSTGSNVKGTYARVLDGRHHAIHQYKWTISFGALKVDATVHWFFANGRTNPAYAVTYDMTKIAANALTADTRSPYGDMQWDYGSNANVDGVGWGDHYKFTTVGAPVCKKMVSGTCHCESGGEGNGLCWTWDAWDYSQTNTVPYSFAWTNSADAEMGLVQSQTRQQHDGGGFWWYAHWGETDNDGPMPEEWNWAFQLNQYELPYNGGIRSKRIAWGMNFGAVGQNSFNAMGDEAGTLDGYPYQSYTTYVVLDAHSEQPVATQVTEVEHNQDVTLTASVGTVRTKGPAGVGRTDEATYAPVGFNPIYGTWEVDADNDEANLTFTAGSTLRNPVFLIRNYGAATVQVQFDGTPLVGDAGYFATIDEATNTVWITLRRTVAGMHTIAIQP